MTEVIKLHAEDRERIGKGGARAVRRDGFVPGIIYGGDAKPHAIRIAEGDLIREIYAGGFFTKLYELDLKGEKQRVLARDVQFNPVKDTPEHIDFLRVTANTKINVDIPVHVLNEEKCPGLRNGGVLNIVRHTVEMMCSANNIPSHLDADIENLEIGDSLHISNITLPEGTKPVIEDRDFTILQIAAPKLAVVEEESEEAEEDEEGAEGEEGESKETSESSEESAGDAAKEE